MGLFKTVGTIFVNQSSLTPALTTLVRNVIIAAAPIVGITSQDTAAQIAAGIVTAGGALYGAAKAYKNNEKLKTVEPLVPNTVMASK